MDIENILQTSPARIAKRASEAEDLRVKWLEAKERYDNLEAKHVLILKTTQEGLKATEIKYYVGENETLFSARLNLVQLESAFRKADVDVKCLEEELRAAKTLARIRIAEISNLEFGQARKEK